MDGWFNALWLSRVQFAVTTSFHMLWPLLSIGLSLLLVGTESAWLVTRREVYYRHTRFWSKLLLLSFGLGVASGLPLEFQFGTNWARFSQFSGGFFGNILGFEAAMAFMLEAAFLGIMLFGWGRVGPRMHLLATCMVALGASLSAFWIMVANAWMQTPAGVDFAAAGATVTNYRAAIFNPAWFYSFTHMWVACIETTLFFVAGVCAWYLRRGRLNEFFLPGFKVALTALVVVAPLQMYLGDLSGRGVYANQPAKGAAMEAHWQTNAPGTGASWAIVAWPDRQAGRNVWELRVPYALSLLATRSPTGTVTGLTEFAPEDRPPVMLPFYAFRAMVLLGTAMLALVLWTLWAWWRGRLRAEAVAGNGRLWRAWVWAIPAGFLATDLGWIVREVGRQPWVIQDVLRTADGVSHLGAASVVWSALAYTLIYVFLLVLFIVFARRILRRGPDLTSPLPGLSRGDPTP